MENLLASESGAKRRNMPCLDCCILDYGSGTVVIGFAAGHHASLRKVSCDRSETN